MENKISIDVTLGDRARSFDAKSRLQKTAYDEVMQSLESCLSQANEFLSNQPLTPSPSDELIRIHNAIFVNGPRGSGKTAFMLNLNRSWKEHYINQTDSLYFFNPIDPTLLDGADSFVNIIVAQIYRIVSKHQNGRPGDRFWKTFEKVAEALEAGGTLSGNEVFGAERVMATRDHAELELNLNLFFRAACEILSAKALVILIDDVDMSLEWGFKVLEVVRRYLACPLIIPILSGDLKQYEVLVMSHFAKELGISAEMRNLSWKELLTPSDLSEKSNAALPTMARGLAGEYLKKVLPLHQRVRIKSIPELLHTNDAPIHIECGDGGIELNDFLRQLAYALSFNANGVEGSCPPVEIETARELMQLLLILYRRKLIPIKSEEWSKKTWTTRDKRRVLADAMNEYWRNQSMPELYIRAQADVQLLAPQPPARLSDVAFFDPRQQDQTVANYSLDAQAAILRARLLKSLADIQSGALPRTLLPMPAFETISRDLFIRKADWRKFAIPGTDAGTRFMMRLYTHSGYYTSYQTANLLFFGRPLEMIISHLLGMIDQKNLRSILESPPYYSYFYFHPTQTTNLNIESSEQDEDDAASADDHNTGVLTTGDFEEKWLVRVSTWYERHPMLAKRPPSAQLIYKVINKFFSQINLYKAPLDSTTAIADTLHDQNLRLKLILMNAFASFENDKNALALENFALGELNHYRSAAAWNLNIVPLLNPVEDTFVGAISTHPLFEDMPPLKEISLTSASSRSTMKDNKNDRSEKKPFVFNLYSLRNTANNLSKEDKIINTRILRSIFGKNLHERIKISGAPNGNDTNITADMIIDAIRSNANKVTGRSEQIASQIMYIGGEAWKIRSIMTAAGRLEELLHLLLDMQ
ncbi:MAG: hypothetical protein PW843_09050 [Azospirillaceae bacterium]|nr:hypothetical protein [Azospirillaceae bacterium]